MLPNGDGKAQVDKGSWRTLARMFAAFAATQCLAACSVSTSVSASASTSTQVQHLFLTVREVWLNVDAMAAADDAGWIGRKLAAPLTIDLATLNSGAVVELTGGIKTPPGTYRMLRLVLADESEDLTAAARDRGLTWNAQIQYLAADGSSAFLPVELPSPASQLLIPVSLEIQGAGAASFVAGSTATSSGTPASSTSIAVDVQTLRNWVLFSYDGVEGALLSPLISAYDSAQSGGITGSLDLSNVDASVLSGEQGIVVTAERLSSDRSRYEAVKSTGVASDGGFTLYPLPVAQSGDTRFDVVIHGPGIRTMVIAQIPVSKGSVATATALQSTALRIAGARHFTVNVAANSASLPGGSRVGFLQTVPGFSAPHLIEYALPDPFSGGFHTDVSLSAEAIEHGLYADGGEVSLRTNAPDEGLGTYRISADSPLRLAGPLSDTITAPVITGSGVQPIFLPAAGASVGGGNLRVNGNLDFTAAGRFDRGFVLISRGGQLIESADITASLSGFGSSASFSLAAIPAGVPGARYDVAVRLWNSRNPAGSLTRTAAIAPLDASAGGVQSLSITVP